MASAFNLVSKGVIFQKFSAASEDIIQRIPFGCAFYAFESPFFYNHCNREGDVIIIPFTMESCQSDLLGAGGGTLFSLTHFRALHSIINHFPSCLFPSIVDDTHIIGPPSIKLYLHMSI